MSAASLFSNCLAYMVCAVALLSCRGCRCGVQVKHFDELQEAKARAVKNLHNAINTKAATAAGNLAGASQQ